MKKFFSWFLITIFLGLCHTPLHSEQTTLDHWLSKAKNNIVKRVLPNGLSVICYPIPNSYKVHVGLTYNAGAKDEEAKEYGLAHMVEHMIFKGTTKMSETDLIAIAEKFCIGGIGSGFNAHTTYDATTYYFNTDKNNWPVFLTILADCMFNVRFDENHFASEVKAVVNEINMRNARPGTRIFDLLGSTLYKPTHPYHHPIAGYKEDLLQATVDHLKHFYKRNYHPSQAVVLIVGDIDVTQALQEAETAFVQTSLTEQPVSTTPTQDALWISEDFSQKNITLYKPVPKTLIEYVWLLPSKQAKQGEHADCMQYVLRNRLQKILEDDLNLVYSLNVGAYQFLLGGLFFVMFEPKDIHASDPTLTPHKVIKKVTSIIDKEIQNLSANGPDEQELKKFKQLTQSEFLSSFESCESVASLFEYSFFPHKHELEPFISFENSRKLTAPAIADFCCNYLRPTLKHTFSCYPIPEHEKNNWLAMQQLLDQAEQTLLAQKMRESTVEPASLVHEMPEPQLIDFKFEKPDDSLVLSNGLTVHLKQRDTTPFISTVCIFKNIEEFGIHLATEKKSAVGQLARSLLLSGSKNYSKQDHKDFFHSLGAQCSFKGNGGNFVCLADDFSLVAQRFLHILTQPTYPQKIFAQKINKAIHNLTAAQEDPWHVAHREINLYLYKDYPWFITDDEELAALKNVTRSQLQEFHTTYMAPENIIMIVVGNFTLETMRSQLEQIFGSWENQNHEKITEKTAHLEIPEIENRKAESLARYLPKEQIVITAARLTTTWADSDRMALKLLEQYVGKKLFEIRQQTGLFYSIHSSLAHASFKTKGTAAISTLVSLDNLAQAETAIKQVLMNIAEHGIPEDQFKTAKQYYHTTLAKLFSTNVSLASEYSFLVGHQQDWTFFDECLQRVKNVTLEQVNAVARTYLNPAEWTFIKVGRVNNYAAA